MLEHAGLVNHALAAGELYRLVPTDRVLQFASPSFDISIEEMFATLAAGGCVVPRPLDLPLGGAELVDWLQRQRITVLDLPTAYWHEWVGDLAARGLGLPSSLRLVVVGGEKASPAAYAAWRRLAGDRVAWVNTYGPTEASVVATAFEPSAEWRPTEGAELPIGRPITGDSVRVLDPFGHRVPVGVRGELYIGGVGVARGYLNQPEATAFRFDADPERTGGRLYRTGDLVRWLADGTLVYAGRTDAQVKLRGFRIEPGEVESALAASGLVDESVVLVRGTPGAERLLAYVVTRGPASDHLGRELREFVAGRLPAHLVPDAVVPLASLPRTVHDKVDMAALPAAEADPATSLEPRDDVERRLLEIWRSVLGRESIGVTDSFFDAGGHSLLAMRAFALVEKAFGVRLPLATLISAPTIAELAAVLRRERPAPSWDSLVPLQPGGSRTPLFLIHNPNGELLIYRDLVQCLGQDQPVYGLQSVGLDGRRQPLARIEDMAAHYVREIRGVQPRGPYLLGGFCYGGVLSLEVAHQLQHLGEQVALVALFDASPYGHGGARRSFANRLVQRVGLLAATEAGGRLSMVTGTVRGVSVKAARRYRWALTRRLLDAGRPLPGMLHDIRFINYMSAGGYRTPSYAGRVALFVRDDEAGTNVTRRRGMWQGLATDLDVWTFGGHGITHRTLLAQPYVGPLSERLRTAVDDALGRSGPTEPVPPR